MYFELNLIEYVDKTIPTMHRKSQHLVNLNVRRKLNRVYATSVCLPLNFSHYLLIKNPILESQSFKTPQMKRIQITKWSHLFHESYVLISLNKY